jgi:WXG100 family type VII secretion target
MSEVLVTFAALAEAAQTIQSTYSNLNSRLDDLKSQLQPVVQTWTGSAAEGYQVQQNKWNQAQEDLSNVLKAIGQAVENAHDAYQSTENANTKSWG